MSNCYIKVCGGIGNQLFQVATGYTYAKLYDKTLIIDSSEWAASQGRHPLEYKESIFKNFKFFISQGKTITEKCFNYSELPYHDGDVILDGYFQSVKYFDRYLGEFIDQLSLPTVDTSYIRERNVAFHVRRGDYLLYPHIYGIGNRYFKNQFEKFKDYQINVFTDSPELVLEEFEEYPFRLIQTSSELSDLAMISQHDNVVCSNSSFSWWGSLLGKKKDKIIVPSKWMNGQDCSDVYRSDMIIEDI